MDALDDDRRGTCRSAAAVPPGGNRGGRCPHSGVGHGALRVLPTDQTLGQA